MCYRIIIRTQFVLCLAIITASEYAPVNGFLSLSSTPSSRSSISSLSSSDIRENDIEIIEEPSPSRQQNKEPTINFVSPLLDYGYPPAVQDLEQHSSEKPILLYLPGFDGTYICPFIQFPELNTEFEVWCMTVPMKDRSSFEDLKACVLNFIETDLSSTSTQQQREEGNGNKSQTQQSSSSSSSSWLDNIFQPSPQTKQRKSSAISNGRPVYLAGESFGGILASDVTLTILQGNNGINLKGLALINPATSYEQSELARKGPDVSKLSLPMYLPGLLGLLPLFADEYSFEQLLLILSSKGLPSVIDNARREAYMGRVAFSLPTILEFMPPGTLQHRLNDWLSVGCTKMISGKLMEQFRKYPKFPTLVIAGENDLTLPSIAEAERLSSSKALPNCQVHVVKGAGHASTCGSRMDMTAVLRNRFPELTKRTSNGGSAKRTAMKEDASNGTGPYFGMTRRYDNANIGLNPMLYWSKENYRKVQKKEEIRIIDKENGKQRMYKKASYSSVR